MCQLRRRVPPTVLADQFLYHEFLKIFSDITSLVFRREIKHSIAAFIRRNGKHHYWLLVAAIAEGWRVKWVYRLLTNPMYDWRLEVRQISDLTMTGFNPPILDRRIHQCGNDFGRFAAYYHRHRAFIKKYTYDLKPKPERDEHPVFVFYEPRSKTLRLFDGMRRTTLAAIAGKKTIRAYVGYPVRPGKPMVNLDKIQFFKLLAENAPKNKKMFQSLVSVGREIVRQSRNGRKGFRDGLKPWSDSYTRTLIQAIIKKRPEA